MPRAPKAAPQAPSTMKELKDTLWKAADKLRGSMDASQYKDVILGLVFLKYVSDAFDERRAGIRAELTAEGYDDEQIADLIDDTDEYTGRGVFWVPANARWSFLAENAKGLVPSMDGPEKSIGALIDEAMDAVMQANPQLSGTLPRIFNRDNVDQRRLGELSGGQRQRVLLAQAFTQEARLLLLDEPITGLDAGSGASVIAHLRRLADSGTTVVVATNDAALIQAADHRIDLDGDTAH